MIAAFLRRLRDTVLDGFRLWWLALLIPLIAAIPEMAQHVAEIRLGMFDGGAATQAAAEDPLRWAFGYAKVAGVLVAMLLAARFWATRDTGTPWWSPRGIVWSAVLGSIALQAAAFIGMELVRPILEPAPATALELVVSIATLPLLIWMMGGLLQDRTMSLARSYTHGWRAVVRIALLTLIPFGAAQAVHIGNHMLAMGQPQPLVWGLMIWDSVLVGTMAAWLGTALHHGYRPLRDAADMDRAPA